MSIEAPRGPSPPKASSALFKRPWGQVALFLIVLTFCLQVMCELVERMGLALGETIKGLLWIPGVAGAFCGLFAWWSADRLHQRAESRPTNPWLRKANFSLGGILLSLVLLQILIPAIMAALAVSHQTQTGVPTEEMKVVSSANGAVAMKVPVSWTELPRDSLGTASLGALSPAQTLGVGITVESRRDVTAQDAADYAAIVRNRFSKEFGQFNLLEQTSSSQSDVIPFQEQLEVVQQGERLRFLLAYQVRPTLFIQLRAWGSPSTFEENEPLLLEMLKSVHFPGDEAAVGASGRARDQVP